jgi:Fe-S-cluster containining protein
MNSMSDWNGKQMLDLHVNCIKNYLSNSLDKQCVFLDVDNQCRTYDARDYNCRAFGIIPKKAYAKRVKAVKKLFNGVQLGLETQSDCPGKIRPETFIGAKKLDQIFSKICDLDTEMGMDAEDVAQGNNYMTFHDHYILYYYRDTPEILQQLTHIKYNYSDADKTKFINVMKESLSKEMENENG